jgi:gas vesicle protein
MYPKNSRGDNMTNGSVPHTAQAFIAGVMVGAVCGLLIAPTAGSELRNSLKVYAGSIIEDILQAALDNARSHVESLVQEGKQFVDQNLDNVLEPLRIGRRF